MSDLREVVKEHTDEYLLDQYTNHREDYMEDALEIMRCEIERRGIMNQGEKKGPITAEEVEGNPVSMKSEDFMAFDHTFSRIDLMLAQTILRENKVVFFFDNPTSNDFLPIESESEKRYTIKIHKDYSAQAHELLDEHFVKADHKYLLKYTNPRDRLRAFNFHDIHLAEKEALEELEVTFSDEEKKVIIALGRRLLDEADTVEASQERILFYYDSIEPLIERLQAPKNKVLSRNELLAILEIMQVYVNDEAFPVMMDASISQLLQFFLGE